METYYVFSFAASWYKIVLTCSVMCYRLNNPNPVLSHTYCFYSPDNINSFLVGPVQLVHSFFQGQF